MKKLIFNAILIIVLFISGSLILMSKNNPTGIRSFTVLSGSMEPTIPTGSMVITKPQSEYDKNDIITFNQNGQVVTHRIVEVKSTSTEKQYITKGDANNSPDKILTPNHSVIGKELVSIPFLGYFSSFLKTLPGLIIFIVLPTLIFVGVEFLNIKSELKKGKEKKIVEAV